MFHSQSLSRKGPLGSVWVAAYCHKRLKRAQVAETDIPHSVDKILQDEFNIVTYRVLGYFLLGVVRIYSKKVDYLFNDCHKVLIKVKGFVVHESGKHDFHAKVTDARYGSITLPKRFELDAFELEALDDFSGGNTIPFDKITLRDDTWRNEEIAMFSSDKWEATASFDLSSPEYNSTNLDFLSFAMNTEQRTFPLDNQSIGESSVERLRDDRVEESTYLITFHAVGGDSSDPNRLLDEDNQAHEGRITHLEILQEKSEKLQCDGDIQKENDNLVTHGVDVEPPPPNGESGKECFSGSETTKLPRLLLSEIIEYHVPTTKTPDKRDVKATAATTPDFTLVPTPIAKEHPRTKMKRKCLFDDQPVLPNAVIKKSIFDSSDLVCKRRKVPHNAFAAWRATQMSSASLGLLEPLIPYASPYLRCLFYKNDVKTSITQEDVGDSEKSDVMEVHTVDNMRVSTGTALETVSQNVGNCMKSNVLELPIGNESTEPTGIAPETPVQHLSSRRHFESPRVSNSDGERPEQSNEVACLCREQPMMYDDQELDFTLYNEEMSSSGVDNLEDWNSGWTSRTRIVARHLNRMFLSQRKQGEEEVLSLLRVSNGKTRKDSARLFYEILVLKSKGYLDVEQANAYGYILVKKLPKWEQAFGKDDRGDPVPLGL